MSDALPYTPFYCEENAWHIARHAAVRDHDPQIVFVTNASRQCALWYQRAARKPGAPVVWDYHVFVIARDGTRWSVWDPDTTLGFPVPFETYMSRTFPARVSPVLAPRFRVIDAPTFSTTFSSDRRHMLDANGHFTAPPPSWPLIQCAGVASNLESFLSLDQPFVGTVLDLPGFLRRFASSP